MECIIEFALNLYVLFVTLFIHCGACIYFLHATVQLVTITFCLFLNVRLDSV